MNDEIKGICPKHGFVDFVLDSENNYRCKICRMESVTEKRRRNKKILIEYKGEKCEICGYNKCADAMEFHHLNPKEKSFSISDSCSFGLNKLKAEVDKCILVCSNCHKEIHSKIREEENLKKQEIIKNNILKYKDIIEKNRAISAYSIKNLNPEDIKEDIKNGLNNKEIALKHQVSLSSIKRYMKKHGIKR